MSTDDSGDSTFKFPTASRKRLELEWPHLEIPFQRACWKYKFDFERVAVAVQKAARKYGNVLAYIDAEHVTPSMCRYHWATLEREGKVAIGTHELLKLFGKVGTQEQLNVDEYQTSEAKLLGEDEVLQRAENEELSKLIKEEYDEKEIDDFNICTSKTIEDLYNECQSQIASRILSIGVDSSGLEKEEDHSQAHKLNPEQEREPEQEQEQNEITSILGENENLEASEGFFGFGQINSNDERAAYLHRFLKAESEAEDQIKRKRQMQEEESRKQRGMSPMRKTSFMSRTKPNYTRPPVTTDVESSPNNLTGNELSRVTYEITSRNLQQVLGIAKIYDDVDEAKSVK